jgi:hypothetical protein
MLFTCIALLVGGAHAADEGQKQDQTKIELKQDQTGSIMVPNDYEVTLDFKGKGQNEMATWSNSLGNNQLEIQCGERRTPSQQPGQQQPGDPGYDQGKGQVGQTGQDKAMLKVGDKQHDFKQGATFDIHCPQGQYANVTDGRGNLIGSMETPVQLTVTRYKEPKDRIQGSR